MRSRSTLLEVYTLAAFMESLYDFTPSVAEVRVAWGDVHTFISVSSNA